MTNTLDPGTVYPTIDEAMRAASCLCGLDPAGATIWGATTGPDIDPATGEAYVISLDHSTQRRTGATWPAPGPDTPWYQPIYTITRR